MSVCGEALSAITGMEEACATARARVDDLVAETDDLRRCLSSAIAQRDEAREQANTLLINCESYFQDSCRMRKERDEARWHAEGLRAALALVEAERDEARAEVERLRKAVHTRACRNQSAYNLNCVCGADEHQRDLQKLAYRRGAEAMREACAAKVVEWLDHRWATALWLDKLIRELPIPEAKP